jgi:hypothetical protein
MIGCMRDPYTVPGRYTVCCVDYRGIRLGAFRDRETWEARDGK